MVIGAKDASPKFSTVEELINNPIACGYLRKFTLSQHCSENLDFWILVDRFKDGFKKDDLELMKQRADHIWDEHVSVTAPAEISLDSATRTIMDELMAKPITPASFDPALKQSLVTLRKDIYPRFVKSQDFKLMKELLAAPQPDHGFRAPQKSILDFLSEEKIKELKEDGNFMMEHVLNDKILIEVFFNSLAKKFCTENLLFYCEVQCFEKMVEDKEESLYKDQAWYIYKNFLEPNSIHQVSTSTSARKEIGLGMASPVAGMYSEVLKNIMVLLKAEFDSFKKSEEYKNLRETVQNLNATGNEANDSAQSNTCAVM